jgi:hypothetical protein
MHGGCQVSRRNVVLSLVLVLWSCGPGEATSLSISAFSVSVTRENVNIDAAVAGDGPLPVLAVEVLRGSRVVAKLRSESGSVSAQSYSGKVAFNEIFETTETAATGGSIDVTLTLRASGEGLRAQRDTTTRIGCGSDSAICAGKCAKLASDADNCGQCGQVCTVQLSTDAYKGRCLNSVCNWPGVTVTSPSSCESVCNSIRFGGRTIKCVGRCRYAAAGYELDGLGVFPGAVVRSFLTSKTTLLSSCSSVPSLRTTDGDFLKQLCCCGP